MIAITIVNYNVPELTDSLVRYLLWKVKVDYKLHVVDNGSDKELISKYTTLRIDTNRNKLGGLLTGMHVAAKDNPTYYWNISTNMQFIPTDYDPANELVSSLNVIENAVAIIPYWRGECPDWTHQTFYRKENSISHQVKRVGIYSLFNAEWLDSVGWFDPCLTSTWGTDFELKYLARKQNKVFLVHDIIGYDITKSSVTKLNRGNTDLTNYQKECNDEMERVMQRKYGKDLRQVIGAYNDET